MSKQTIESLVDAGNASGGPPLGPALGPTGLKINDVVAAINEKTKDFAGMKVPVKVIVDPSTKEFEIEVGSPPTSALIKKEISLEKGAQDKEVVGDLTFEQALKITNMKRDFLLAGDMKGAIKEVLGVCQCVGVTVDGKPPKQITLEIDEGKYNDRMVSATTSQPSAEAAPPTETKQEAPIEESKDEEQPPQQ